MARTIDNLGVDISSRYAEDQASLDETFLADARIIPQQTKVSVTAPSFASEFAILFELGKRGAQWASFYAPPRYYAYRRRLFAEQLIPDLGSPEMQESQMQRIESYLEEENTEIHTEKGKLLKLLKSLHAFDQLLIDINSRRAQYQKG